MVVRPCLVALVAVALALAQRSSGLCTPVASSYCPTHASRSRFSFYGTNYCRGRFGKFRFPFSDARHASAFTMHRLVAGNDAGHLPIVEVFLQTVQPLWLGFSGLFHTFSVSCSPRRVKPYAHACHAVLANPSWPRFSVVCMGIALWVFLISPYVRGLSSTFSAAVRKGLCALSLASSSWFAMLDHAVVLGSLCRCHACAYVRFDQALVVALGLGLPWRILSTLCLHRLGVCRELSWPLLVWPDASTACSNPSLMLGIRPTLSANPRLCPLGCTLHSTRVAFLPQARCPSCRPDAVRVLLWLVRPLLVWRASLRPFSSASRIPSVSKAGMSSVNNSSAKTARQSRREQ
ncbi:hypothetical protein V6N13_040267 [Hibiscus sabdariffa]